MKIVGRMEEKCSVCGECETTCSQTYFEVEDREKSAIRVREEEGQVEISVCNQCGTCVDYCPVMALKNSSKGTVILSKKTCIGCFFCVGVCPTATMFWHPQERAPFKCIACARCTEVCSTEAIYMDEVSGS